MLKRTLKSWFGFKIVIHDLAGKFASKLNYFIGAVSLKRTFAVIFGLAPALSWVLRSWQRIRICRRRRRRRRRGWL